MRCRLCGGPVRVELEPYGFIYHCANNCSAIPDGFVKCPASPHTTGARPCVLCKGSGVVEELTT